LFADSVADLAILGPTDPQGLWEESEAYEDFVEPIKPIAIADTKAEGRVLREEGRVWLLSLDLQWYPETVFRLP
jgi:hypothetical protein